MSDPPRRRLDHVDAMRPVKQAGVISTHTITHFAPAAASVSSGAALLLLHVSREGFFFVSACMLTYAYGDLQRGGLRRFYWRRFLSVGVPYLCWTVIYFLFLLPTTHYHSVAAALAGLGTMLGTGYYQLYFLLVIMQFYLVFPLTAAALRRTRGHHGLVLAAAAAAQVAIAILSHWNLLPPLVIKYEPIYAVSYVLYLTAGCVVACHLERADAWVRGHARLVVTLTLVAALAAEGVYFLAQHHVTTVLGWGDDAFQPSVIPFNAGAIACGYLAGVALVRPGRSRLVRAVVRSGADNAYGIYLSHMLVITTLGWLGWGELNSVLPWPVVCLLIVCVIVACCVPLTALLARTPLAMPLTGRRRVPWPGFIDHVPVNLAHAVVPPGDQGHVAVAGHGVKLHVGCPMWSYPPWQGRYLPAPLGPRERLRAYATWCNAVEGNTTFYATPAPDTVRSWAGQTGADFRFILKLPRMITHERRLADVAEPLRAFLAAIEPLGERAHALWVQLPASFGPADTGALGGFLRRLPREHRYCVEVRHREFFSDARAEQRLEAVLGNVGAEWVPFDTTVLFGGPPVSRVEREAWRQKPRVPRRTRALTSSPVVRYIGRDDPARTVAGWQPWLEVVAGWLREGRSPTVFIHTPDNVQALELARRFHSDVRALVPSVSPLPEPVPAGPPTLF